MFGLKEGRAFYFMTDLAPSLHILEAKAQRDLSSLHFHSLGFFDALKIKFFDLLYNNVLF